MHIVIRRRRFGVFFIQGRDQMFFGILDDRKFQMKRITESYIYHKDKENECYFIGDILSSEEESYCAFYQFMKSREPESLLYLRGNYQVIVRLSNEFYVFADLGNIRPIYYGIQGKEIFFSSHLCTLRNRIHTPINSKWFQRSLISIGFHTEFESPFEGIYTIPGGFGYFVKGDKIGSYFNQ